MVADRPPVNPVVPPYLPLICPSLRVASALRLHQSDLLTPKLYLQSGTTLALLCNGAAVNLFLKSMVRTGVLRMSKNSTVYQVV